ncbi:MAG: recombination mediator RecR [Bdellovibrionaceae bacterium]|nr:recombination mediator RecR [Pseudobdellovibrionaceae bacterium]
MFKIGSLEKLIHELNRLPGVGPKTAQRLAYFILRTPEYSSQLRAALHQVEVMVHLCSQCFSYTDADDLCRYCTDPNRRDDLLCVVEEPSDIARVEGSGVFRGRYHVLQGAISPLDNVSPQDLKIRELLERVDAGLAGTKPKINEVILALDPDLEGDTTVLYLAKMLAPKDVKVTRIASGVPIGSDIDYVDDRTLGRALENRVEL